MRAAADHSPADSGLGSIYDALVIAAHPDDAEVRMGGTIALLTDAGRRVLLVDLVTGEPTEFVEPFRSLSPLLVADPGVFLAGIHG